MISILTPIHKLIPWWNLRILGVCCQTYQDWEWILLDNSPNGFVKEYIDNFFENLQGIYYKHCRGKIKIYHEPFNDVSLSDGRIGKLKNRCAELSSATDDDIIMFIDYDDFLNTRTLEYVNKAIYETGADAVRCDIITSIAENIETGVIYRHSVSEIWCHSDRLTYFKNMNEFKHLYETDDIFKKFINEYEMFGGYMADEQCVFNYDELFKMPFTEVRKAGNKAYMFSDITDRYIGKRSSFYKIGCYCEQFAIEDFPLIYGTMADLDVVYVPYPYLCIVSAIDSNGKTMNSSSDNAFVDCANNPEFMSYMEIFLKKRYDKYKTEPITFETYKI